MHNLQKANQDFNSPSKQNYSHAKWKSETEPIEMRSLTSLGVRDFAPITIGTNAKLTMKFVIVKCRKAFVPEKGIE
jgi:hypothetical protein